MSTQQIPDLHDVVLRALELHASYEVPQLRFPPARKRLVIASGNALPTGRILFSNEDALFLDEGQYGKVLERDSAIDSAVVISASGKKHAPVIVGHLLARGLTPYLVTCSPDSPAAALLPRDHVFATKSNPEPITYNTSTYLGMILAQTREDPASITRHVVDVARPMIPDFTRYKAFYLMVGPEYDVVCPMFITKFDELFGGRLTGRCYTTEQTMHAKTVVPWEQELFIGFGYRNQDFGSARLNIPLPAKAGFAAMIATGYYVIGHIQAQMPPWFKEHAEEYAKIQQALFKKVEAEGQPGSAGKGR